MDEATQKKLLEDPQVQAAIKKAGTDALNNPEVQAKIVAVAKEKFPEVAGAAQAKVMEWAKDPEVQAKAYHYAGIAGAYLGSAGVKTVELVEQGPTGVRILAFVAGLACCVNAVMFCASIGNIMAFPVYVVSGYQIVFSVTTMIFESPPSVIEKIPGITKYQDMLMEKAKFLSEVLGRGLFYLFQGSLWLAFSNIGKITDIAVGLFMIFVGILHIIMHFGQLGTLAGKMREGYNRVAPGP